ncbi:hypothetical protein BJ878DRAFT_541988 [Calycina marina]|uniref:2EXR domain-containing protein n=1 Tax=Calycina marina TaxID=1763456 RepID=A0A9P7Z3J5_9HELO|nr:hypothetical protein BJ878DRAFT_541988 [Calycina marina]
MDGFPNFEKLAPEIRDKIWGEALKLATTGRLVNLELSYSEPGGVLLFSKAELPPLFYACKDSRAVAVKLCPRLASHVKDIKGFVPFDFKIDRVHVDSDFVLKPREHEQLLSGPVRLPSAALSQDPSGYTALEYIFELDTCRQIQHFAATDEYCERRSLPFERVVSQYKFTAAETLMTIRAKGIRTEEYKAAFAMAVVPTALTTREITQNFHDGGSRTIKLLTSALPVSGHEQNKEREGRFGMLLRSKAARLKPSKEKEQGHILADCVERGSMLQSNKAELDTEGESDADIGPASAYHETSSALLNTDKSCHSPLQQTATSNTHAEGSELPSAPRGNRNLRLPTPHATMTSQEVDPPPTI